MNNNINVNDFVDTCACSCPEIANHHHADALPSSPDFLERTASLLLYALNLAVAVVISAFLWSEFRWMAQKRQSMRQPHHQTTFDYSEMIQYRLDYYFSTSQWAKPALLLICTFVLIVVGAVGLAAVDPEANHDTAWIAWTYVADPGTHADAQGTLVRLVSFLITIGGMVIFALMIGIISDFISERVDDLKQGKSRVIESNHTLMLGWSDKSLAIIEQLCLANESEGGGEIVVLAVDDKQEMEAKLHHATEDSTSDHQIKLLGTQVIFRSGNPLLEHELRKVSVSTARAIVVLSPPDVDPDKADSLIVRQVLALKAVLRGKGPHMVVEMQDIDNKTLVELVDSDQNKVEVIVAHDIIGRLMIQCAREPGLAYVLESLLGFDGDEFYFQEWPQLHGKTFLEVTCRFDDAVPIGVKRGSDQRILLNPPNDYIVEKGDKILCLAEDNDSYEVNDGSYSIEQGKVSTFSKPKRKKEKLLFCGLRRDMADMIMLLDELVVPGSELWLFNEIPVQDRAEILKDKDNKEELVTRNLVIKNAVGSPIVRRHLRLLSAVDENGDATGRVITLDEFDSILILSDAEAPDTVASDSRSLASLLLVQDLQRKISHHKMKFKSRRHFLQSLQVKISTPAKARVHLTPEPGNEQLHDSVLDIDVLDQMVDLEDDRKNGNQATESPKKLDLKRSTSGDSVMVRKQVCDPIGEILETRTRSLLQVAGCKGYVMSNHIVSMMMACVAEDRDMNSVLGELLSAHGSESKFMDIRYYLDIKGASAVRSFWDVAVLARQRREVAVGYKPRDTSWVDCINLILNPPDKAKPRRWEKGDIILVFALE